MVTQFVLLFLLWKWFVSCQIRAFQGATAFRVQCLYTLIWFSQQILVLPVCPLQHIYTSACKRPITTLLWAWGALISFLNHVVFFSIGHFCSDGLAVPPCPAGSFKPKEGLHMPSSSSSCLPGLYHKSSSFWTVGVIILTVNHTVKYILMKKGLAVPVLLY